MGSLCKQALKWLTKLLGHLVTYLILNLLLMILSTLLQAVISTQNVIDNLPSNVNVFILPNYS